MRSIISLAAFAALVSAAPVDKRYSDFSPDGVYFPLDDGFPTPSADQLQTIQKQAFGTLSNAQPPDKVSDEGITNFQLVAANEILEVAYFTELHYNVTNKAPGYDLGYAHQYVLDELEAIIAQEKLHALNANGALKKFGKDPIQPCKYSFPVTDFQSAIALAATFTDVVMGTLQDVIQQFALNGDTGFVRGVAASLGNEGEQEGFFRLILNKRPSSQPFLTTSVRDFAFTAINGLIVPGSCPNIDSIPLKIFKPLTVVTQNIQAVTQNIEYSFPQLDGVNDYSAYALVLINGQNKPIVEPLTNVAIENGVVTFDAAFPFDENNLNGLTITAVTNTQGPFATAGDVAKAAVFGPGVIET
ncbi:late sexual development protein [Lophiostoma macrostomum CBS 122681]|uniref:Late sexual development protein n=1 Tax=Lophiostoma macrostomum CBS 122681 TaxID=1314788 RepID=A0A6A6TCY9_9PLEO|nr:late sexual development protein [Lophiostoma macrostomum CBS 122681]